MDLAVVAALGQRGPSCRCMSAVAARHGARVQAARGAYYGHNHTTSVQAQAVTAAYHGRDHVGHSSHGRRVAEGAGMVAEGHGMSHAPVGRAIVVVDDPCRMA